MTSKRTAPTVDLGDYLDREVLPRLSVEEIYTHPCHNWKKAHDRWRGACFNHDSKSGTSFVVTLSNKRWFCAGCSIGGGPLQYLDRIRGGDGSPRGAVFVELAKTACEMAGVPFPSRELTDEERREAEYREARRAVLDATIRWAQGELWSALGDAARRYLIGERHLTEENIRDLGLGLYTSQSRLVAALNAAGCRQEPAVRSAVTWNQLAGYVLFPWMNERGEPLTLYGRWPGKPPGERVKTIALPGDGTKAAPLYLDRALAHRHRELVLVEGVLDGAILQVVGDTRVVACVAASLSKLQGATLKRCGIRSVTIALDPDQAGDSGILSCVRTLLEHGITPYVAPKLPEGLDPDEFVIKYGIDAWKEHVAAAVHGYRHVAQAIIRQHLPEGGWTDRARSEALRAADRFATEARAAGAVVELDQFFFPEIAAATGAGAHGLGGNTVADFDPDLTDPDFIEALFTAIVEAEPVGRPALVRRLAQGVMHEPVLADLWADRVRDAKITTKKAFLALVAREKKTHQEMVREQRRQDAAKRAAEKEDDDPAWVKQLADAITEDDHFAQDNGGRLYVFRAGVYRDNGAAHVRRRVKALLEEWEVPGEWSSHRANEVVEYIRVDSSTLWEQPPFDTVNVLNGILDCRTRELRDHDPEYLSAVQLPVVYDPAATCPEIDGFVAQTFPDDARAVAYEVPAWLMIPGLRKKKSVLLQGEGNNGKSVYLALVMALIGRHNTAALSLQRLSTDRFSVSRLIGKLANICPDTPSTHLDDTSVFKSITGDDPLEAEYKFRDGFAFVPFCRMVFSANHLPRSKDSSEAFFKRWLVVPFDQVFEGDDAIPREVLDAKLQAPAELSGLLNRALDVLPKVIERGITESPSMVLAWDQFRTMTDPLSVWLDRSTVSDPGAIVAKQDLITAFNEACATEGRPPMTNTAFGRILRKLRPGVEEAQRTFGGVPKRDVYLGIGLKTTATPPTSGRRPREVDPFSAAETTPVHPVQPVSRTLFNRTQESSPSGDSAHDEPSEAESAETETVAEQGTENRVNWVNSRNRDGSDKPLSDPAAPFLLAEICGFPKLQIAPDRTVKDGREAWELLCTDDRFADLRPQAHTALLEYRGRQHRESQGRS